MITSLLIANRGEIARRIIRTAKRMGIRTVAVYSDADKGMPFVREADEAVRIGTAQAADSYLKGDVIIAAAKTTGSQAIHPGYGFLSENAAFADAVVAAGLIWIGAPPAAIRAMGLKDAAKRLMIEAGVPVTPGYMGDDQGAARLQREADAIGYPVLIKAVAGGGGKGMRKVDDPSVFGDALASCRREAEASFGDDRVLIEKYITRPRHIEVQVFGDSHGNVVHLFERDCSLQRRHQKVIEEAPAPGMDDATRAALCDIAVRAAKAVNYVGAGTIEFIADASAGLRADRIWFMEMNTRLQVEHPVTEAITGQDLVEWQIRVASGEPLPRAQDDLAIDGWAMEARLYAENPNSGFLPSIGHLEHLRLPHNIRTDCGVEQGDTISPFYDPMIAKLIAHASTRRAAAAQLAKACAAVEVWPVKTNAAFLARAASAPAFLDGDIDTGFIAQHADALIPADTPDDVILQAAARSLLPSPSPDPWIGLTGFRLNAEAEPRVLVAIGGGVQEVAVADATPPASIAHLDNGAVLFQNGEAWPFGAPTADVADGSAGATGGAIFSPMPGRVVAVHVAEGERVTKGQKLVTVEAMKMEHTLTAPFDGTVAGKPVAESAQVVEGQLLATVEAA